MVVGKILFLGVIVAVVAVMFFVAQHFIGAARQAEEVTGISGLTVQMVFMALCSALIFGITTILWKRRK
jgi:hypothetical protein